MKNEILEHFKSHFEQLKTEVNNFPDDDSLWVVKGGISNSAGNLCFHLLGNINHYIGFVLGKTNYKRNRDLEFSVKNISRAELTVMIEKTIIVTEQSLEKIIDFNKAYPEGFFDQKNMNIKFALIKLITHFNYHLGQINYHRRLLFPNSIT